MKKYLLLVFAGVALATANAFAHCGTCGVGDHAAVEKAECAEKCAKACCAKKAECAEKCAKAECPEMAKCAEGCTKACCAKKAKCAEGCTKPCCAKPENADGTAIAPPPPCCSAKSASPA